MNWSYDVIADLSLQLFYWHSFHPLLIRYPRWTRNCVTGLRSFKGSAGSMRLWFFNNTTAVTYNAVVRYAITLQ